MSDQHRKFMDLAFTHSNMSHDPSTKVGAIITLGDSVVSFGYNQIADGIPHTIQQMHDREWKYPRIIHAEQNAIMKMMSSRIFSMRWDEPYHMYVTHHPCERCAAMIIHAGIKEVFTRKVPPEMLSRWPGVIIAADMFKEAKIPVNYLDL